jgi:hypothetical protein
MWYYNVRKVIRCHLEKLVFERKAAMRRGYAYIWLPILMLVILVGTGISVFFIAKDRDEAERRAKEELSQKIESAKTKLHDLGARAGNFLLCSNGEIFLVCHPSIGDQRPYKVTDGQSTSIWERNWGTIQVVNGGSKEYQEACREFIWMASNRTYSGKP